MKRYKVFYKMSFISNEVESIIILAKTEKDAFDYFFKHYSGYFLRAEFLGWA